MIDRVAGMIRAPPTPMIARVPISWFAEVAIAEMIEPNPKIRKPICSAGRRPKRSPSAPALSSRPAKTNV